RLRTLAPDVPGAVPKSGAGAGVRIELRGAGTHGVSPGGGIVLAGRAVFCDAGGGAGLRDSGPRPRRACDRYSNTAEAGGKTEPRVAGEQAAPQAGINWPTQRGCIENRTPGVL